MVRRAPPRRIGPRVAPSAAKVEALRKPVDRVCALNGCESSAWQNSGQPLRCYAHRAIPADVSEAPATPPECAVEGCSNKAQEQSPCCRKHKITDLSPEALAAHKATFGKPGPKPRATVLAS
jgi:hypothetical protein